LFLVTVPDGRSDSYSRVSQCLAVIGASTFPCDADTAASAAPTEEYQSEMPGTIVTHESLKVDVTVENLEAFESRGVVGVAIGDVLELLVFVTRDRVVQRVVPVLNGEESSFDLTLSDAAELVREVPDLLTVPLRAIRFEDAAAAGVLAAMDEAAEPPAESRPPSPAAETPAVVPAGGERLAPATAPDRASFRRAEPRRSPVAAKRGPVVAAGAAALANALADAKLTGYAPLLAKARILDLAELLEHSVSELEESLRRPHVAKAKDFTFSSKERRGWASIGLADDYLAEESPAPLPRCASPAEPRAAAHAAAVRSAVISALGEALPEADLARLGDMLDESAAAEQCEPEKRMQRQPVPPKADLFDGATAAAVLLGRCDPAELSLDAMRSVLRIVLGAVAKEFADADINSIEEAATSVESAVDVLDSALVRGCRSNLWAADDLEPPRDGLRAAMRLASELAFAAAQRRKEMALKESPGQGDDLRSFASVLLDQAGGQQLSQSDQKFASEYTAGRKRAEAVAADAVSRARLAELRRYLSGSAEPAEKLAHYAEAASKDAKLAALLKASHLKDPRGAAIQTPHLTDVIEHARAARADVLEAGRKRLKVSLPAHGNAAALAAAAFSGMIGAEGSEVSLSELANPEKPKGWLGTTKSGKADASSESAMLIQLFTAVVPLMHSVMLMMPSDDTVLETFMSVMADVAKGLKKSGAERAVDAVLAPLFREYASAWTSFQKNSEIQLPKLGDVWKVERAEPAVQAYLAEAAKLSSAGAAAAQPAAAETASLKSEQGKLRDMLHKLSKRVEYLSDADGDEERPNAVKNKAKKERQKKAKEEAKRRAALSGGPPGAPAAAGSGDDA
jgi:hypothetical protein